MFDTQLNTRNNRNSKAQAGGTGLVNAVDRIMIGYGDSRQPFSPGESDQIGRCHAPVGESRMNMQINGHFF
ncbi:MAG: hypothetical protein ACD_75C01647G0002 [uncultured bacterium]|nr:MAG: hypothetical protein ACD_75C01647G0002 [uncultured bacterium]